MTGQNDCDHSDAGVTESFDVYYETLRAVLVWN